MQPPNEITADDLRTPFSSGYPFPHKDQEELQQALFLKNLGKVLQSYLLFQTCFFCLGCIEIFLFFFFFSFFIKSSLLAFTIAGIFFTCFSYFVLLFYFQAKKPDQFQSLVDRYVEICRSLIPFEQGTLSYQLALTKSLDRSIDNIRWNPLPLFFSTQESYNFFSPVLKKITFYLLWKDIFKIKELFQHAVIRENIQLVKSLPTHLEAHLALAKRYIALSTLYKPSDEMIAIPTAYAKEEIQYKFKIAIKRAIEEFKIINEYSSNDRYIHFHLAYLYHELNLKDQEIAELETVLKISPDDPEVLLKLGILYFEEGHSAEALRIYERLKEKDEKRAEVLISYYDASYEQIEEPLSSTS